MERIGVCPFTWIMGTLRFWRNEGRGRMWWQEPCVRETLLEAVVSETEWRGENAAPFPVQSRSVGTEGTIYHRSFNCW